MTRHVGSGSGIVSLLATASNIGVYSTVRVVLRLTASVMSVKAVSQMLPGHSCALKPLLCCNGLNRGLYFCYSLKAL